MRAHICTGDRLQILDWGALHDIPFILFQVRWYIEGRYLFVWAVNNAGYGLVLKAWDLNDSICISPIPKSPINPFIDIKCKET